MRQDGWDVLGKVGGTARASAVVGLGDISQLCPSPFCSPPAPAGSPGSSVDLGSVTSRKAMLAAGTARLGVQLGFSKQDLGVWMEIPAFPAGFCVSSCGVTSGRTGAASGSGKHSGVLVS